MWRTPTPSTPSSSPTPPAHAATFEHFYDSIPQSLDLAHNCGMRNNTSIAECTQYIGILTPWTRDQIEAYQRSPDEYGYMYDELQPCFSKTPDDGTYYWYVFVPTLFNHTHSTIIRSSQTVGHVPTALTQTNVHTNVNPCIISWVVIISNIPVTTFQGAPGSRRKQEIVR